MNETNELARAAATLSRKAPDDKSMEARSNAAAVLGRKGGTVAASRLTPEQRRARASKGGLATYIPPISPADLVRDRKFLKVMDDRERAVILGRFSKSHKTLEEIADDLGLTRQRVHQLQNSGLAKMAKAKADWESRTNPI